MNIFRYKTFVFRSYAKGFSVIDKLLIGLRDPGTHGRIYVFKMKKTFSPLGFGGQRKTSSHVHQASPKAKQAKASKKDRQGKKDYKEQEQGGSCLLSLCPFYHGISSIGNTVPP